MADSVQLGQEEQDMFNQAEADVMLSSERQPANDMELDVEGAGTMSDASLFNTRQTQNVRFDRNEGRPDVQFQTPHIPVVQGGPYVPQMS